MDCLNHDNQADVTEAYNSTSRYLDDLLDVNNPYLECMVYQIYPRELHVQLNGAHTTDNEAPFKIYIFLFQMDLFRLSFTIRTMTLILSIVNFPFLNGDLPRRASYGVHTLQLIRFARVCNHVTKFNARNKILHQTFSSRAVSIINFVKLFSKFYRRHYICISKFNVGIKALLREGLSCHGGDARVYSAIPIPRGHVSWVMC